MSHRHETGLEHPLQDRALYDVTAMSAAQPLLTGTDPLDEDEPIGASADRVEEEDDAEEDTEDGDDDDTEPHPESAGRYVWLLTLAAGLSGLLFGYDTGVMSATLVSIGPALGRPLTSLDKSVITSVTSLLALAASPAGSVLADARGRRAVLLAADALFVAGALVQAFAASVAGMVVGRAVVGAAVGAASFVVPMYIAEVAPAAHRGRLVTVNVLFITLGQVVAYVLGWLLTTYGPPDSAWRWLVGLGAAPALLQAVLVAAMPESPRWLVQAGHHARARAVVARVGGSASDARRTVRAIAADVHASRDSSLRHRWRVLVGGRRDRRALALACLLQGLQQLCGFNSLMYFSATVFALVGFAQPTLVALVVAATNLAFTVVALVAVDRIGRRRVLLWSIPAMAVGLLLAAWGFGALDLAHADPAQNRGAAALVLVSIMVYVAAYAIGMGNVPWMQSELFGLEARSLGSGLATACNWLANFCVGLTFLPLLDWLTPSWTFSAYAGVCVGGFVLVRRYYPETAGLSLEAAARLLDRDDWGVE